MNPRIESMINKAIIASVIIHALILAALLWMKWPLLKPQRKTKQGVEITYRDAPKTKEYRQERPIKPLQELDLQQQEKANKKSGLPVPLTKSNMGFPKGLLMENKSEQWRSLSKQRKQIVITPMTSEKINNPAYAQYSDMVRARIEEKFYALYDRQGSGRVFLTFVVGQDGRLKDFQIIDEKTDASEHIQELSLMGLKQASPFPPFYKGMALLEYTFKIEVQYQTGE